MSQDPKTWPFADKTGWFENISMEEAIKIMEDLRLSLLFDQADNEDTGLETTLFARAHFLNAIAALETAKQEMTLAMYFYRREISGNF